MLKLLDTTVRDGSYVIDFQFSAHDTSAIAARLDDAGVHYIETGHGLGLGAGKRADMLSADSDERYLEATALAVKNNKWGMFFIPGIGRIEDIELAFKYGMKFIRIGTNVTEIEESRKYIEKAKSLGMYVFANYMKTYALSAAEVGKLSRRSADFGTDVVCVVDSAGGMMPEEVRDYINAIKDNVSIEVGFHGHNNLGLAIANSLVAVECGAGVIDTSVRGMGRSSGNAVTEMFLFALKRRGVDLGIDTTKILDLAEKIIDPFMKNYKQVDSVAVISGYAQFHSSFQSKVFKYAKQYGVDPRELIVQLTMNDKVNAPDELLIRISEEIISRKKDKNEIKISRNVEVREERILSLAQRVSGLALRAKGLSRKWGKSSVFNMVQTMEGKPSRIFTSLHENESFVLCSGEFALSEGMEEIIDVIDQNMDYVLLDCDIKSVSSGGWIDRTRGAFKSAKVIPYSDIQTWAESISHMVISLLNGVLLGKRILVFGNTSLSQSIYSNLSLLGVLFEYSGERSTVDLDLYDVIIFCEQTNVAFKGDNASRTLVIDGLIGALSNDQLVWFQDRHINIYRPEMITNVLAKLVSVRGTMSLVAEKQGIGEVNNTMVAAGGIIASRGTVIVDSVKNPSKVFGVANGMGLLLSYSELSEADRLAIKNVEDWILNQALN